jgi:hypothetical protein
MLAGVAALAVALVAPGGAAASVHVISKMNGNKVVPGPGDPNGQGRAELVLKQRQRQICFTVSWSRVSSPVTAEIRRGSSGETGPRKAELFETSSANPRTGCSQESARQIRRIRKHPRLFYLELTNNQFPNGAIRGQLRAHEH